MVAKYQLFKNTEGHFYFRLKSQTGEILLISEGYISKQGCENGIRAVKHNSRMEGRYQITTSISGKYYLNLVAQNGQVVGTSELYKMQTRIYQIKEEIKRVASIAFIEDLT